MNFKANVAVFCAVYGNGVVGPHQFEQWSSQRRRLLSNAENSHPVRNSTTPTECLFPARWRSYTDYTRRPLSFARNVSETIDWKICSNKLAGNNSRLCSTGHFPERIGEGTSVSDFSASLGQPKRRITTAIRRFIQEVFYDIGINFENRMHAAISELGNHIRHQWHSIKPASVQR